MSNRGPILASMGLFIGLTAIVQTVVGPRLALEHVKPDIVLLVVLVWTLVYGSREGIVLAFVGGFWLDLFSGGMMGMSSLSLIVASLVAGVGYHRLVRSNLLVPVAAAVAGTLSYSLFYISIAQLAGLTMPLSTTVWRLVIPGAIYNTVLMLCLPPFLNRIPAAGSVS